MNPDHRTIIGIDPGSRRTGYGILKTGAGGAVHAVSWGVIRTDASAPFPDRMLAIHEGLIRVMHEYSPAEAVIEKVFLSKNPSSALKLGHARGVAILTCGIRGIPVFEYSAREIKSAMTGYGAADKEQVAAMVARLLGIRESLPEDASDALAIAFCGATSNRSTTRFVIS